MNVKKVLFITQEIVPYVSESAMSSAGRYLPQAIQESGREIRTFMPRWGGINERRNQLHEVIRLSGMNIIIDDTDHPLIIKVASIQAARMQDYFIDNDDYFHKRQMLVDENGEEYPDNVERAIFYARGVLETVKKLRWCPDVIHCFGWMSAVAPLYIKTAYKDDPPFANAKVIYSAYNEKPSSLSVDDFKRCLSFRSVDDAFLSGLDVDFSSPDVLNRLAVAFSDGLVQAEDGACPDLMDFAAARNLPLLAYPGTDSLAESYGEFYEKVFSESQK